MMLASVSAVAEQAGRDLTGILCQPGGNASGVCEVARLRLPGKRRGGARYQGDCSDHDEHDTDPQIGVS
jgi:hypothetical protein